MPVTSPGGESASGSVVLAVGGIDCDVMATRAAATPNAPAAVCVRPIAPAGAVTEGFESGNV